MSSATDKPPKPQFVATSDSESAKRNPPIELTLNDCPSSQVTVFEDRAEINRQVLVSLSEGETEIRVCGVSDKVISASVRVSGRKASPQLTILEVKQGKNWLNKGFHDIPAVAALKDELQTLQEQQQAIEAELERIKVEANWLHSYAATLSKPTKSGASPQDLMSTATLASVVEFMKFYHEQMAKIDERKFKLNAELKTKKEEVLRAQKTLSETSLAENVKPKSTVEISIFVLAQTTVKADLILSYILMGASWSSSYDARVSSSTDKLEFIYYANIVNESGEGFLDTELSLSTATPSIAGKPPNLFGKTVGFQAQSFALPSVHMMQTAVSNSAVTSSAMMNPVIFDANFGTNFDASQPASDSRQNISKSMASTIFNIPRKANIESDGKPHQVTIQKIILIAVYSYTILPIASKAYLKASITNTTSFPFLKGQTNVFMDNNYVAKSSQDLINPGESLGIFLGVDESIKVEHQELQNINEIQGTFLKSQRQSVRLNTIVKSSKDRDIDISVFHQLPRSNRDEIKVVLKEPSLEEGSNAKITLTAANNIERKAIIPRHSKVEFPFSYYIDFPAERTLDIS